MPKVSIIQNSFNAGEWSPRLDGRVDMAKYANSCKELQNFVPLIHGGIQRRSGTRFVNEIIDSSKRGRLIPFQFSVQQAYMLEFGDNSIRVYKDGGIVTSTVTITNAVDNGSGLIRITSASHGFATGTVVKITGVTGTVEANATWTITKIDVNTFDLQGSAFVNAYTGLGTAEFLYISTTYTEAELSGIKNAQSADVLFLAHPDHLPAKLSRFSDTEWLLEDIVFNDGPYLNENITATTLTCSAATGNITVTASGIQGINNNEGFKTTDIGRFIRIYSGGAWGFVKITGWTSTTIVSATVIVTVGVVATERWRLGVMSETTGFPKAVTISFDRLTWGGYYSYPQRVDMSVLGDYYNMSPSDSTGSVVADNAVSFTLGANDVNAIQWLTDDEQGLFIGTNGGEWLATGISNSAITPASIKATRSTVTGCADISPVRAGKAIMYIQRSRRKVHELSYSFNDDGFLSPDMTLLAEHITKGGISEMAFQGQPIVVVWVVRDDGVLLGFSYDRENEVFGWHKHILGGSFGSGNSVVESIAVIPDEFEDFDQLWLIVKRTVDGNTVRYIEILTTMVDEINNQEDYFFVDCGLTYDGIPADVITGLDHLEGETVKILADGATHPDLVVASGQITLNYDASVVHVGLEYESKMQTNLIDAGAADGTAQGKFKRINNVTLRLYKALGGWIGADFTNMDELQFRIAGELMNNPPTIKTNDYFEFFRGGWNKTGYIAIKQVQPLPFTLLALISQLDTNDR